ncbi:hypothetical protein DTO212C5_7947 [Paecilomyces variotii]|nr:hypothetical protein DTO212C5_7947 [Paecilomyces variotii]
MNGFHLLITAFSLIGIACSRVFVPGSNQGATSVKVYPGTVQNGISHAQFSSSTGNYTDLFTGVDSPKLDFINSTVTQWWYFDAVSTDLLNSLTIIFFTSTSLAFPFILPSDSVTVAYVWATFPNGTVYTGYTTASFATITTIGDGSSGSWESTGFKWDGDPKMQKYTVTIESNEMDISGTLELDSIAPAHYPSGPVNDREKQSLQIAPHIGWTNAIPDSKGTVNFNIKGTDLQFEGSAYHDQNWADAPFETLVGTWYWGHGRLGNYSLVWFSVITPSHEHYVNSYVSLNGRILCASNSSDQFSVRTMGPDARYPPRKGDTPDGFSMEFDLGDAEGGRLSVNVTTKTVTAEVPTLYTRWIGSVEGKLSSQSEPFASGSAIHELFTLTE